ncbi:MAG: hypothetical protein AB1403_16110 [Candidatus Riflebacteria bacterium]
MIKSKKGSAIITAIGMGIVFMLVIMGLQSFSSFRIQTTIQTSRKVKALAIAEAGVEIALAELNYKYGFSTHQTNKELKWLAEKNYKSLLKNVSDHGFTVDSATSGTYSGKLGDGSFKVKVANIPYKDDDRTLNINEEFAYILIESLGRYEDTVKRIKVVTNRRYPSREFLMYDGDVLSLVYGEPGESNTNSFSTGHLYGHNGVEISRILTDEHNSTSPGTNQELSDMNAIISGAGRIFFFSPIKVKFRDKPGLPGPNIVLPKNFTFPSHGSYSSPQKEKYGEYPQEMKNARPQFGPEIEKQVAPWVKDKADGISIDIQGDSIYQFREDAKQAGKGLYFAANYADSKFAKNYRVPDGWTGNGNKTVKSILLDFGDNIRPGNVTLPANFNGVIFAEDNIIIKGNPPKSVNIVTPQNVFVAGDFNQAGDKNQIDEFYGFPQDYESNKNALTANDYRPEARAKLLDDFKSTGFQNHVAAKVIADKRIVYDYRSPVDCFENELFPYMKYKLASYIDSDEDNARDNTLEHNKSGKIVASATTEDEFEADLDKFFNDYKIDGSSENALKEELKDLFNDKDGKFNFNDFDEACRKVWKEYAEKYDPESDGEISTAAQSHDYGVYRLLNDLRTEMKVPDNDPDAKFQPTVVKDQAGDYVYYPEMTTNGMFISHGVRNNLFYAGPDYTKIYNEIGRSGKCVSSKVGLIHSGMLHMVHRVFGSEIYLRKTSTGVQVLNGGYYAPPTRKKLYDETLPSFGLSSNSKHEMASYRIISWQDTIASTEEFEDF